MSMSDDPRGFRRGHPGSRDHSAPQEQGRQGRANPPREDRFDPYRQPETPGRPERPQDRPERQPEKQQPSFSAYRPEAYAQERGSGRPEQPPRADWQNTPRAAPPQPAPQHPRSAPPQAADPFARSPQARDPFSAPAAPDPYAAPTSSRGFENDWGADSFGDPAPRDFPSYYPQEDAPGSDAQSVHDRFFAESAHASPPPPPSRFKGSFDDEPDFGEEPAGGYAPAPSPYPPAQRHTGVHGANTGFDDQLEHDDEWEKFDQAPAPAAVRPFHAPATIPDDDIDADFFADEDEYDVDDYPQERKGGRKKLMAAVLLGAVVTGGGLAYIYKSNDTGGDGGPSVIAADTRPVKEEPEEPGGRDFPNGNKLIYDRLGGVSQDGGPSRLASGPAESSNVAGVVTTGGTLEERIENALKAQNEEPTGAGSPDSPRTVRTMTFGPDGTQKEFEPRTQRLAANPPEDLSSGIVVTTEPTSSREEFPQISASESESDAAPEPEQPRAAPRIASVEPDQKPAQQQLSISPGGTGNFFVQIAARNDQEAAMAAFASLQQKYAGVLGNHSPSVRKVDLGEKGVWFRLLVGPVESKSEADQLCEQLKTAGMKSCFARKD